MKTEDTEGPEHSDYCGFAGGPILPGQSCFCANQTKATLPAPKVSKHIYEQAHMADRIAARLIGYGDKIRALEDENERLRREREGMVLVSEAEFNRLRIATGENPL